MSFFDDITRDSLDAFDASAPEGTVEYVQKPSYSALEVKAYWLSIGADLALKPVKKVEVVKKGIVVTLPASVCKKCEDEVCPVDGSTNSGNYWHFIEGMWKSCGACAGDGVWNEKNKKRRTRYKNIAGTRGQKVFWSDY